MTFVSYIMSKNKKLPPFCFCVKTSKNYAFCAQFLFTRYSVAVIFKNDAILRFDRKRDMFDVD